MLEIFNLLETLASLPLQVNKRTGLSPSVLPPGLPAVWPGAQPNFPSVKGGIMIQYCIFSSWRKLFFISQKFLETIRG